MAISSLRCLNVMVPTLSPARTSPSSFSKESVWLTLPLRSKISTAASGSESVAFTVLSIQPSWATSATTGTSAPS